jgi:MSHA biogenesis protein MshJ
LLDSQVAALKAEILVATKTNVDLEKAQLENAKIKKQLENLQAVLSSMQVSKPQIGELVKSALKDYPHVTLVSLKTLPVTTLIAAVQANRDVPVASIAAEKPIYKHGVEVEIHGGYLDLLACIKNLEDNSQNVFWADARLLTVKYPETSLRLTIFILSDQPILEIS